MHIIHYDSVMAEVNDGGESLYARDYGCYVRLFTYNDNIIISPRRNTPYLPLPRNWLFLPCG